MYSRALDLNVDHTDRQQNLNAHQTETGRPVTDAVVQEVCKLRPDMIGMNLRDCVEVSVSHKTVRIT